MHYTKISGHIHWMFYSPNFLVNHVKTVWLNKSTARYKWRTSLHECARDLSPTAVRPTAVRPTAVRPTAVRPTAVRPTAVRPTAVRPTAVRRLSRDVPQTLSPCCPLSRPGTRTWALTGVHSGAWQDVSSWTWAQFRRRFVALHYRHLHPAQLSPLHPRPGGTGQAGTGQRSLRQCQQEAPSSRQLKHK